MIHGLDICDLFMDVSFPTLFPLLDDHTSPDVHLSTHIEWGKCPHSAGEVPNVVLFIRLTPTVMFAMGSFCPTGHLCSCMFEWPFVGPFGGLSTREHSLQEK